MFRNRMPRYEILSEDAMATLDQGWRRLIVRDRRRVHGRPGPRPVPRRPGQKVEDNTVFLDPDFVLEQVAKAPREFDVQARNPENTVHIGGDAMAFGAVYGPPFVREGEVRRDAHDGGLPQLHPAGPVASPCWTRAGGVICEPNDTPLDSRHLDMIYALQTLTDKIYMGNVVSGPNAADTIAMTEILFGGAGGDRGDAGHRSR